MDQCHVRIASHGTRFGTNLSERISSYELHHCSLRSICHDASLPRGCRFSAVRLPQQVPRQARHLLCAVPGMARAYHARASPSFGHSPCARHVPCQPHTTILATPPRTGVPFLSAIPRARLRRTPRHGTARWVGGLSAHGTTRAVVVIYPLTTIPCISNIEHAASGSAGHPGELWPITLFTLWVGRFVPLDLHELLLFGGPQSSSFAC